jgi:hypothetical protein
VCACDQPNAMWRFGWTNGSTIDLSHSEFEPLIFPLDGTSTTEKTPSFRRSRPSEISPEPSEVVTSDGLRRVPS